MARGARPTDAVWELVVPRSEIYFVSWAFDASDGVALVRTDDASTGKISLLLPDTRIEEAGMLLDVLESFGIEIARSEPYIVRTEDTR